MTPLVTIAVPEVERPVSLASGMEPSSSALGTISVAAARKNSPEICTVLASDGPVPNLESCIVPLPLEEVIWTLAGLFCAAFSIAIR